MVWYKYFGKRYCHLPPNFSSLVDTENLSTSMYRPDMYPCYE